MEDFIGGFVNTKDSENFAKLSDCGLGFTEEQLNKFNMNLSKVNSGLSNVSLKVNGSLGSKEDIENLKVKISEEIEKYVKRTWMDDFMVLKRKKFNKYKRCFYRWYKIRRNQRMADYKWWYTY